MRINRRIVTIPISQSLSEVVQLGNEETIVAVEMPSGWTAAGLSFASTFDGTSKPIIKDSVEFSLAVAPDQHHVVEPSLLVGVLKLQLRSGTSTTPVTQAAARQIIVITAEL